MPLVSFSIRTNSDDASGNQFQANGPACESVLRPCRCVGVVGYYQLRNHIRRACATVTGAFSAANTKTALGWRSSKVISLSQVRALRYPMQLRLYAYAMHTVLGFL